MEKSQNKKLVSLDPFEAYNINFKPFLIIGIVIITLLYFILVAWRELIDSLTFVSILTLIAISIYTYVTYKLQKFTQMQIMLQYSPIVSSEIKIASTEPANNHKPIYAKPQDISDIIFIPYLINNTKIHAYCWLTISFKVWDMRLSVTVPNYNGNKKWPVIAERSSNGNFSFMKDVLHADLMDNITIRELEHKMSECNNDNALVKDLKIYNEYLSFKKDENNKDKFPIYILLKKPKGISFEVKLHYKKWDAPEIIKKIENPILKYYLQLNCKDSIYFLECISDFD